MQRNGSTQLIIGMYITIIFLAYNLSFKCTWPLTQLFSLIRMYPTENTTRKGYVYKGDQSRIICIEKTENVNVHQRRNG